MAGYKNFQVDRNKYKNKHDIKDKNFNKDFENLTKSERIMRNVGVWVGFYRANPHRFVKDYLNINLKLFQKILIYMMNHNNYFMYLASRGQGKTTLTAIFCCVRAILYPETKIIVASGNLKQAIEVIEKINDFRNNSPNLVREIRELKVSTNDARIEFYNGSWIKVVASNDGARSKRANLLIVDEFRMVDLDIINKVLRKFLTAPRNPRYLDKPEYKNREDLKERNKEIYLSSAWYKYHWSWEKVKAYYNSILEGKSYFLCGLPYELSIAEGLLMKDQVLDEMSESDFDEVAWYMEMECMFFGELEGAYFKYEDVHSNRKLLKPLYPLDYYNLAKDKNLKYEPKKSGEIRFISCDIANSNKKDSDNSAYTVFRLKETRQGYERQVIYMETWNGENTVAQALRIRKLYEELECDYIVLDTRNVGSSVYESLADTLYDKETNREYAPLSCINDESLQEKCMDTNAPKVIYSIQASSKLNSDCAVWLRADMRRNKIKFLVDENVAGEAISKLNGLTGDGSIEKKEKLLMPFKQITLFLNETINLESEINKNTGDVSLKEPRSGRKDRYTSIAYGNYFATYLERDLRKKTNVDYDSIPILVSEMSF